MNQLSDESYYIQKPTKEEFDKAINNFWWVSTYVAKGIWREELPYVKYMFDVIVRESLNKLINWYIGMNHDWEINTGTVGRWFEKLLPTELWEAYKKTYAGSNYEEIWTALRKAGKLVRVLGLDIATQLDYTYPIDDERVVEYLNRIRGLPRYARE